MKSKSSVKCFLLLTEISKAALRCQYLEDVFNQHLLDYAIFQTDAILYKTVHGLKVEKKPNN